MGQKIRVSCQKTNLKKIRAFLKDCLVNTALSASDAHLVIVAIDEVCANLMIHSHNCDPQAFLEVDCYEDNVSIIIDIYDQGELFRIDSYEEPPVEKVIQEKQRGGMGLIIVKRIMDHIAVIQENNYNIYRMKKSL